MMNSHGQEQQSMDMFAERNAVASHNSDLAHNDEPRGPPPGVVDNIRNI